MKKMKNILTILSLLFCSVIAFGQTNLNYIIDIDMGGKTYTQTEIDTLNGSINDLLSTLPVFYRDKLKVVDFGLYLHNEDMSEGIRSIFNAKSAQVKALYPNDYLIILGKITTNEGVHKKIFVDLVMPDREKFDCLDQTEKNTIQSLLIYDSERIGAEDKDVVVRINEIIELFDITYFNIVTCKCGFSRSTCIPLLSPIPEGENEVKFEKDKDLPNIYIAQNGKRINLKGAINITYCEDRNYVFKFDDFGVFHKRYKPFGTVETFNFDGKLYKFKINKITRKAWYYHEKTNSDKTVEFIKYPDNDITSEYVTVGFISGCDNTTGTRTGVISKAKYLTGFPIDDVGVSYDDFKKFLEVEAQSLDLATWIEGPQNINAEVKFGKCYVTIENSTLNSILRDPNNKTIDSLVYALSPHVTAFYSKQIKKWIYIDNSRLNDQRVYIFDESAGKWYFTPVINGNYIDGFVVIGGKIFGMVQFGAGFVPGVGDLLDAVEVVQDPNALGVALLVVPNVIDKWGDIAKLCNRGLEAFKDARLMSDKMKKIAKLLPQINRKIVLNIKIGGKNIDTDMLRNAFKEVPNYKSDELFKVIKELNDDALAAKLLNVDDPNLFKVFGEMDLEDFKNLRVPSFLKMITETPGVSKIDAYKLFKSIKNACD